MIVKIEYSNFDLKHTSLEVVDEKPQTEAFVEVKTKPAFIIVRVNKSNIQEAIENLHNNNWVVGYEYSDDIKDEFIQNLDFKNCNVYKLIPLGYDENTEAYIDSMVAAVNPNVRLVFKFPESFCDMQFVRKICDKYPNVTFDGGYYMRIKGTRIGAVMASDINSKSKIKSEVVVRGNCSVNPVVLDVEVDYVWGNATYGTVKKKSENTSVKKEKAAIDTEKTSKHKTPKKVVSYASSGGLAGF